VPKKSTIWEWLFEPPSSFLRSVRKESSGGFSDAQTGRRISFDVLKQYATALSTRLSQEFTLLPGENVAVICENSIWYPVAVFAALRLGATVTALSPEYGPEELVYALKIARSKIVFIDGVSFEAAHSATKQLGIPTSSVVRLDWVAEHSNIESLVDEGLKFAPVPAFSLPIGGNSETTCAFLSFTSGTTGLPKAIIISHRNVIAQAYQVLSVTRPGPAQKLLGVLPLFHITGIVHILQLPVLLGQEVILMSKFTMQSMLDAVAKYRCEELWLVPPLLIRLVNDATVGGYDLSSVKQFNTGAAPLAPEIIAKLGEAYPQVAIRQAWGMTESCSCLTVTPPEHQTYANAHTVGKVVAGTTLKVIDVEDGQEMGVGEVGEILARGPQVTIGYLQSGKGIVAIADDDGYLHTGDLGSIDEHGFITIHDRIKELIKVKGIGVAPAELEDVLLSHEAVQDAAVVGMPDDYSGEVPKGFVVLKPGAKASARQLQDLVRERKARAKWLTGGVEFLDVIPKSASGKILRRKLRDKVRRDVHVRQSRL
ncbi:CoA ligase-like protein, partial [Aaosphaeria arxii CBS 175.79]